MEKQVSFRPKHYQIQSGGASLAPMLMLNVGVNEKDATTQIQTQIYAHTHTQVGSFIAFASIYGWCFHSRCLRPN